MLNTMIAPLLVTLLPFLLGSPSETPQDPPDPGTLVIQGDGLTLGKLLAIARAELDIECFLGPDARDMDDPVHFDGVVTLAPGEFLPFFEQLLRTHDYMHFEMTAGRTSVHHIRGITAQGGRGSNVFKTMAQVVTPEQARAMGNRNTLITTTYTCKYLPARDAVNTLQPYFADSFTDNLRNIEGTPHIIMTSFASTMSGILNLLDAIDVEPAEDAPIPVHPTRLQKLEKEVQKLAARVKELESSR